MNRVTPDIIHVGPCNLQIPAQSGGAIERRMWEIAQVQVRSGRFVQVFSIGSDDTDKIVEGVLLSYVNLPSGSWFKTFTFLRRCASRIRGTAAVLHFHSMPEAAWIFRHLPNVKVLTFDFPRFRRGRRTPLFFFYRWCLTHFDLLLPVSEFCQKVAASYWVLSEMNFRVVHNGVNLQQFRPDSSLRAEFRDTYAIGDSFLLTYAGRVNEQKGTDLLLDSYCELKTRFPSIKLAICGPPGQFGRSAQTELSKRIAAVGGLYLGDVSENLLTSLYNATDLFVLPTRRDEMFGMVAVEAQACSAAVVCSDTGGLPEVISKESGASFRNGCSSSLTSVITKLLDSPDQLTSYREHARQNAARFAWQKIAVDLDIAYRCAAGRGIAESTGQTLHGG